VADFDLELFGVTTKVRVDLEDHDPGDEHFDVSPVEYCTRKLRAMAARQLQAFTLAPDDNPHASYALSQTDDLVRASRLWKRMITLWPGR
jgi:hypothetical protein